MRDAAIARGYTNPTDPQCVAAAAAEGGEIDKKHREISEEFTNHGRNLAIKIMGLRAKGEDGGLDPVSREELKFLTMQAAAMRDVGLPTIKSMDFQRRANGLDEGNGRQVMVNLGVAGQIFATAHVSLKKDGDE